MHSLFRSTAAVAAVALLAACGGGDADMATDTAGVAMAAPMAGDTMATMTGANTAGGVETTSLQLSDANTSAQLDSVAAAARSGLTSLPPAVAIPLVNSLAAKLRNSGDAALQDIAGDLETLRGELSETNVNGRDIGQVLARVGPKVTAVADRGGAAAGTLRTIGTQLTSAGRQLSGS